MSLVTRISIFLLGMPFISILDVSLSFFTFTYILVSNWHKLYRFKSFSRLLWLYIIVIALSIFLQPLDSLNGANYLNQLIAFLHSIYWLFLAFFGISLYKIWDDENLGRVVYLALNILVISFFFFQVRIDIILIQLSTFLPRNSHVFTILCLYPLSLGWVKRNKSLVYAYSYSIIMIIAMVLTEGRAGSLVIVLQTILHFSKIKLQRVLLLSLPVMIVFSSSYNTDRLRESLGNVFRPLSGRIANLVEGQGDGDLSYDKSWLVRELMVEKAKEIFIEYPLTGIGLDNFTNYNAKLSAYYGEKFQRLSGSSISKYNTTSAHNSYVQVLAESGLIALLVLLIMIIYPFYVYFTSVSKIDVTQKSVIISLLGASIHLYAISALTGSVIWIIIGLAWGSIKFSNS